MAITLDGTSGITTPDVNSDSYTGALGVDASAPDDSLVVDSAGKVGIGVANPNAYGSNVNVVSSKSFVAGGAATGYGFYPYYVSSTNYSAILGDSSGAMTFTTGTSSPTERARIDSSGNLLVGTTATVNSSKMFMGFSGGRGFGINDASGGAGTQVVWFQSAGTQVGSITTTTSATSYNTSSDYRLKENVVVVTGASARVQQLNPVRFNFIADPDTTVDGFLAHEVQDVVPEAITGTKDATEMVDVHDEDGNVTGQEERPVYQGIDQSKLVPLLTAALQEALTKIETLEARVAALEAA